MLKASCKTSHEMPVPSVASSILYASDNCAWPSAFCLNDASRRKKDSMVPAGASFLSSASPAANKFEYSPNNEPLLIGFNVLPGLSASPLSKYSHKYSGRDPFKKTA
eukprot:CAMPEP_0115339958 /NCGR_PEP_ID=MMETSP0270-20121206/90895_1 /TAXON_ID=71861 /ORGANISM="Scrippsiella trochoidea, Strain CCMP3099" /LENGTH=106 /DNA_ID=CAMNT_0002761389 /DNA_START=164 /DNA_END=484 /DNA_ORIENTATION=-